MGGAGVRAVQPVLPVLRGAVCLPAVLQDAGQGEPGLQGLPGGKYRTVHILCYNFLTTKSMIYPALR